MWATVHSLPFRNYIATWPPSTLNIGILVTNHLARIINRGESDRIEEYTMNRKLNISRWNSCFHLHRAPDAIAASQRSKWRKKNSMSNAKKRPRLAIECIWIQVYRSHQKHIYRLNISFAEQWIMFIAARQMANYFSFFSHSSFYRRLTLPIDSSPTTSIMLSISHSAIHVMQKATKNKKQKTKKSATCLTWNSNFMQANRPSLEMK